MKLLNKLKSKVISIGIFILLIAFVGYLIHYAHQYTENKYLLSELNDGVYAIYYNTHSSIPAENYEVITVCCEGNVYTFNGDVFIFLIDGEPYVNVKNYNMVNCDEIYVYVPQGTVVYEESVNISR